MRLDSTGIMLARGRAFDGYNARRIFTVLAITAACIAIGLATAHFLSTIQNLTDQVLLAFLIIVIALLPVLSRIVTGQFSPFEPIIGACVAFGLLFGLRPVVVILQDDTLYQGYDLSPYITRTLLICLLGIVAFIVAYELFSRGKIAPNLAFRSSNVSLDHAYIYTAIMFVIGLMLFALHLSLGGSIIETLRLTAAGRSDDLREIYSRSSEYLNSAPLLTVPGATLLILASKHKTSKRHLLVVALAILFPVIVFGFIGNRRFILPSIAIPVAAYYLSNAKRPSWKLLAVIIPIGLILISTIPYARAAGARERAGGIVPIFQDALQRPGDSLWHTVAESGDTAMFKTLTAEVAVLDKASRFSYGSATIGDFLLAPIPSSLIPGKPLSARDEMLTMAFGDRCRVVSGGFCPDFTVIGTFYQDLWIPGVVLGMGFLGGASGLFWRMYRQEGSDLSIVLVSCTAIFVPIMIRAGFMPPFAWFLYFLIPAWVGLWFASKRAQRDMKRQA